MHNSYPWNHHKYPDREAISLTKQLFVSENQTAETGEDP